jgi:uncharacterized repeat protein (TIGR01451 family)
MFKFLRLWCVYFMCTCAVSVSAQTDLSLSLTVANEYAATFQNITYTYKVKNTGNIAVSGVKVNAVQDTLNASFGLVFTSATTQSGSFNVNTGNWSLDTIKANDSATLVLTLFTLKPQRPVIFAQIIAANALDIDSAPNNGVLSLGAREDDEVLRAIISAPCVVSASVTEDSCYNYNGEFTQYRFKLAVNSTDATLPFVEVSTNSLFLNSSIVQANTVFAPFGSLFSIGSTEKVTYYLRPYGQVGCVSQLDVTAPANCAVVANEPTNCLLSGYFPDIFCIDNGQNAALRLDLLPVSFYTNGALKPNDNYAVFLDNIQIGSGTVQYPIYLGLQGAKIPMSSAPRNLRIERVSDNKCIASFEGIILSDYCVPANTAFCQQQAIYPWEEYIQRVRFGNIDQTSLKSPVTNYTFFNPSDPTKSATVIAGDSVPFSITVGYNFNVYTDFVSIFLDSDRNGTFDQSESIYEGQVPVVASGSGVKSTLTAFARIPSDAKNGATTMKIVLRRGAAAGVCTTVPYGEVELYNVRIGGGSNAGACGALSFEVLGVDCDDNGTPSVANDDQYYINYLFDFPGYAGTATYSGAYWTDNNGQYTSPISTTNQGVVGAPSRHGPVSIIDFPYLNFRVLGAFCNTDYTLVAASGTCSTVTASPTANCAASSNFPWEDWISRVKVRNQEKVSQKAVYSDFKATPIQLTAGSHPFSLRAAFSYLTFDEYVKVWIDYNQDGVLSATEVAYQGKITAPANGVPFADLNTTINIPASALAGTTLMRVRMSRYDFVEACGVQSFGEVEDYTVQIVNGLGLQSSNQTQLPVQIITDQKFYPNPAADRIYLQFEPKQDADVSIMNHLGQVVMQTKIINALPTEEFDITEIMNGHYILRVEVAGQRARTHGLVVAKQY